jgi:protein ImuA
MPSLALSLPSHVARAVWRGLDMGHTQGPVRPSGHALLDAELPGGGWPCHSLIDVLQAQAGLAEWRLLSPTLKPLLAQGARVLLIGPPHMPGLSGLWREGVSAQQLVWVQANTVAERLWAAEQALKTPCLSAVLCWLPQARPEQIRRLHACAAQHPGLLFVFRSVSAQADSSAAPLRLRLGLGAWPHPLEVTVVKRRGPAMNHALTLSHWPVGLTSLLPRWHPSKAAPAITWPTKPVDAKPVPGTVQAPVLVTSLASQAPHVDLDRIDSWR